jgi:hypothetical protein
LVDEKHEQQVDVRVQAVIEVTGYKTMSLKLRKACGTDSI